MLPRMIALIVFVVNVALILSLVNFQVKEISWTLLNPSATPETVIPGCSNWLGVVGLYTAGLLYYFFGAAIWWVLLLLFYIPFRLFMLPNEGIRKQSICLTLIILTSCSIIAVQPWFLDQWTQEHMLVSAGGQFGHIIGTRLFLSFVSLGVTLAILLLIHAVSFVYYCDSGMKQLAEHFWRDCCALYRYLFVKVTSRKKSRWQERAAQELEELREDERKKASERSSITARPHSEPEIVPSRRNPYQGNAQQVVDQKIRMFEEQQAQELSKQAIPTARNFNKSIAPTDDIKEPISVIPMREYDGEAAAQDDSRYMPPAQRQQATSTETPSTPAAKPSAYSQPAPQPQASAPSASRQAVAVTPARSMEEYVFPPYELLHYEPISDEVDMAAQREMANMQQILLDTLSAFGYAVEPGDITRGPSITRYEIYPAKGLRINRITALRKDLMLATSSESINIIAPIPGKNSIGIELANEEKSPVFLRELLQDEIFLSKKFRIPVALGKDVYGNTVIGDLASMPHTLVAGTTGSGKSVCINSMIISMLYKFTPEELKLILIDPKTVEMQPYLKVPHLAIPVITDPARVIGALRWAVNEMEHRYRLFSRFGVRNFEDYNECSKDELPVEENYWDDEEEDTEVDYARIEAMASEIERQAEDEIDLTDEEQGELPLDDEDDVPDKLPYIVIIIDELADLMMVVKEDLENYVARLTQKARAAGIHLVVATQTPRSNVVTGIIKANIPSRIAFKVSSPLDSRIILDMDGADNLLGKGDCLFLPPTGIAGLTRAQGAFVSDREIQSVVTHCAMQVRQRFIKSATAELNNSVSAAAQSGKGGSGSPVSQDDVMDELYNRCVEMIIRERKASVSMIQRRFRIGYNRASLIMETLEERGIVSAPRGGKSERDILVDAPCDDEE